MPAKKKPLHKKAVRKPAKVRALIIPPAHIDWESSKVSDALASAGPADLPPEHAPSITAALYAPDEPLDELAEPHSVVVAVGGRRSLWRRIGDWWNNEE